jgi:hypothetical protein
LFSTRPSSIKLSKASTNEANAASLVDPLFQEQNIMPSTLKQNSMVASTFYMALLTQW